MTDGGLKSGERNTPITNGKMRGDEISFSAAGAEYIGHVTGTRIEGRVKSGGNTTGWSATRGATPAAAPKY